MRYMIFFCWLLWPVTLFAQSLAALYTNPQHQKLPEAIILYNSAALCENCSRAINMLVATLKQNYRHRLHAYLIDTKKAPQFAVAFSADAPITLVIVRISDGASFGYQKLSGLQSLTDNPSIFSRRIVEFINNFLGWS
ncbi:MAG: hypothetical protein IJ864_06270 [Alphaproteobacteria bacterium]|nr:hypothetical protein [Alphaproteobacteria bacterium]